MINIYNKKGKGNKKFPAPNTVFKPGDRVKRIYYYKNGKTDEYKGIVMGLDNKSMEIYWDIVDGKYQPNNIELNFTNCSVKEIFQGNKKYSPIKKERNYLGYIFNNI
jgi:hypothetical protein